MTVGEPVFYSYASPEPAGYSDYPAAPETAKYNRQLGEFLLPYEDVRTADAPPLAVLEFLQSTYEAGAERGRWDRAALEEPPSWPEGKSHAA